MLKKKANGLISYRIWNRNENRLCRIWEWIVAQSDYNLGENWFWCFTTERDSIEDKTEGSPPDDYTVQNVEGNSTPPQADDGSHGDSREGQKNEQPTITGEKISSECSYRSVSNPIVILFVFIILLLLYIKVIKICTLQPLGGTSSKINAFGLGTSAYKGTYQIPSIHRSGGSSQILWYRPRPFPPRLFFFHKNWNLFLLTPPNRKVPPAPNMVETSSLDEDTEISIHEKIC